MFGCDAKIGLSTSSLPHGLLCSLESEEDLVEHLNRAEEEGNDLRAPINQTLKMMGLKLKFAQYVKKHVLSK